MTLEPLAAILYILLKGVDLKACIVSCDGDFYSLAPFEKVSVKAFVFGNGPTCRT